MGINAGMFFGKGTVEEFIGFIRPVSPDIESVGFSPDSGTDLFARIAEVTHDSDTSYILSTAVTSVCATETNHDCEITLGDPSSNPGNQQTITVRAVARFFQVSGSAPVTKEFFFVLKEGGTDKATSNTFTLTTSYQTFTDVLTQAQKDSISDWNAMTLRMECNFCIESPGPGSVRCRVTQAEVEFA